MSDLKPCPFCGSSDAATLNSVRSGTGAWRGWVLCGGCWALGPLGMGIDSDSSMAEAARLWNTRQGSERDEIVAWLRAYALGYRADSMSRAIREDVADAIEAGAHAREGGR